MCNGAATVRGVDREELRDAADRGDGVSAKKGVRRCTTTLCGAGRSRGKVRLFPTTEDVKVSMPFHSNSLGDVPTAKLRRDSTKLDGVRETCGTGKCCFKGEEGSVFVTATVLLLLLLLLSLLLLVRMRGAL